MALGPSAPTSGRVRPCRGNGSAPPAADESYLKVNTGLLGPGKDLYIPLSAAADVSGERVWLTVDKDRPDEMGWGRWPEEIAED